VSLLIINDEPLLAFSLLYVSDLVHLSCFLMSVIHELSNFSVEFLLLVLKIDFGIESRSRVVNIIGDLDLLIGLVSF